ncbi:unnamed protein product [Musa acuminata subsp. burmannicoides]
MERLGLPPHPRFWILRISPRGKRASASDDTGKTRGMGAGRKLKTHRRRQRWADKAYEKSHLGNEWKKTLCWFFACHMILISSRRGIEAKQPNSAIQKCARVQLIKNGKKIAAFVPNDGCLNFIEGNDEVLIAGFGRKGHADGDIPGVRFKVVKVSGVSLLALFKEKEKPRCRGFAEFSDESIGLLFELISNVQLAGVTLHHACQTSRGSILQGVYTTELT